MGIVTTETAGATVVGIFGGGSVGLQGKLTTAVPPLSPFIAMELWSLLILGSDFRKRFELVVFWSGSAGPGSKGDTTYLTRI